MQKDIFYDELSVYENLYPAAMLRLPYSWPPSEKQRSHALRIRTLDVGTIGKSNGKWELNQPN